MYVAILGRQSEISLAELSRIYGSSNINQINQDSATIAVDQFDFERLGGSQKAGKIIAEVPASWVSLNKFITTHYSKEWSNSSTKITLGISAYGTNLTTKDIQKIGLNLKTKLKTHSISLRLIPNKELALNTATSHHNKLGLSDNHVELLICQSGKKIYIAKSIGAQNITALASRDQARPKTDAFVGMLPPKLARIMVNIAIGPPMTASRDTRSPEQSATRVSLASSAGETRSEAVLDDLGGEDMAVIDSQTSRDTKSPEQSATRVSLASSVDETRSEAVLDDLGGEDMAVIDSQTSRGTKSPEQSIASMSRGGQLGHLSTHNTTSYILDPFCGTGVILQEASLLGLNAYGTDLSEKMVDYSRQNLDWLRKKYRLNNQITITHGNAMTHQWTENIYAVVSETYLGQPFSAPPSPSKLKEVRDNCDHITTEFLRNIHPQIASKTKLCIAVPAWRRQDGRFEHLPMTGKLTSLGYQKIHFDTPTGTLLYCRDNQVVAREILLLEKP